jgi:glucan biosynthesis protein C
VLDQHIAFLGEKWRVQSFQNGRPLHRISSLLRHKLNGWRVTTLPLVALGLTRIALPRHFATTHDVVNHWYNHADYFTLFLIGALPGSQPGVWRRMEAQRFAALGIAPACWAALTIFTRSMILSFPSPDWRPRAA